LFKVSGSGWIAKKHLYLDRARHRVPWRGALAGFEADRIVDRDLDGK